MANVGLAAVKIAVGVAAGSQVLIADGVNSAGDVVATAIGWVGFTVGRRPPDVDHPYGHGAFEAAAGLAIGAGLVSTGVYVAVDGLRALVAGPAEAPGAVVLAVAVGTAVVKEALYRYTTREAERLNSPALRASARDHRADVGLAGGVFVAVVGARAGWPWLDPVAAVGLGAWIGGMGLRPLRDNAGVLLDEAPPGVAEAAQRVAGDVEGVRRVDRVRVHALGTGHVVAIDVSADAEWTLHRAHALAHAVSEAVVAEVPHVTEAIVHVNPYP